MPAILIPPAPRPATPGDQDTAWPPCCLPDEPRRVVPPSPPPGPPETFRRAPSREAPPPLRPPPRAPTGRCAGNRPGLAGRQQGGHAVSWSPGVAGRGAGGIRMAGIADHHGARAGPEPVGYPPDGGPP